MSAAMHIPEPWKTEVLGDTLRITKAELDDGNDDILVLGDCRDEQKQANARRIVAAVNACAGVSTDALEKIASLNDCKPLFTRAEIYQLILQRDELSTALQKCRTGCEVIATQFENAGVTAENYREAVIAADAALAKVKSS